MSDLHKEVRRHVEQLQRKLRGEVERYCIEAAGVVKRHRERERQIARRIDRIGR